jgi:hypothetical protein
MRACGAFEFVKRTERRHIPVAYDLKLSLCKSYCAASPTPSSHFSSILFMQKDQQSAVSEGGREVVQNNKRQKGPSRSLLHHHLYYMIGAGRTLFCIGFTQYGLYSFVRIVSSGL